MGANPNPCSNKKVFLADGDFAPSKDIQPSYKPSTIKGYRDAEIPSGERR